jgi:hypothetical protein
MDTDTDFPANTQDLNELAMRIRDAHRGVQAAGGALLHQAMAAGDALIAAQQKVSSNWKPWLRENCFLSVDTALVYQRLARHREQIEAELGRVGELSLRAALRLIAEPKPKNTEKKKQKGNETLLAHWKRESNQERTDFLDGVGVDGIRKAASLGFYRELKNRLHDEKVDTDPNSKLTKILRQALSHLKIADDPTTGETVAASQINATVSSLRGILRQCPDFLELAVVIAASKARRRAA